MTIVNDVVPVGAYASCSGMTDLCDPYIFYSACLNSLSVGLADVPMGFGNSKVAIEIITLTE